MFHVPSSSFRSHKFMARLVDLYPSPYSLLQSPRESRQSKLLVYCIILSVNSRTSATVAYLLILSLGLKCPFHLSDEALSERASLLFQPKIASSISAQTLFWHRNLDLQLPFNYSQINNSFKK